MTWLGYLNFLVFQWFFLRLARIQAYGSLRTVGFVWLGPIIPFTGWWSDFRYLDWRGFMHRRIRRFPWLLLALSLVAIGCDMPQPRKDRCDPSCPHGGDCDRTGSTGATVWPMPQSR